MPPEKPRQIHIWAHKFCSVLDKQQHSTSSNNNKAYVVLEPLVHWLPSCVVHCALLRKLGDIYKAYVKSASIKQSTLSCGKAVIENPFVYSYTSLVDFTTFHFSTLYCLKLSICIRTGIISTGAMVRMAYLLPKSNDRTY